MDNIMFNMQRTPQFFHANGQYYLRTHHLHHSNTTKKQLDKMRRKSRKTNSTMQTIRNQTHLPSPTNPSFTSAINQHPAGSATHPINDPIPPDDDPQPFQLTLQALIAKQNSQILTLHDLLQSLHAHIQTTSLQHARETAAKTAQIKDLQSTLSSLARDLAAKDAAIDRMKAARLECGRAYWDRCHENKRLRWKVRGLEEELVLLRPASLELEGEEKEEVRDITFPPSFSSSYDEEEENKNPSIPQTITINTTTTDATTTNNNTNNNNIINTKNITPTTPTHPHPLSLLPHQPISIHPPYLSPFPYLSALKALYLY